MKIKNLLKAENFQKSQTLKNNAVYLYDTIGADFFGGVSAIDFAKSVEAVEGDEIHVYIDSAGGDVFEAQAMVSVLRRARDSGKTVVAHVDGLAASSASWLALESDRVVMSQGAFFMVHNSWGFTVGNAAELRQQADLLDKIDSEIIAAYEFKTKKNSDELRLMMAVETWLNSDEAKLHGFVDEVAERKEPRQSNYNLAAFNNAPKEIDEQKEHARIAEQMRNAALRRITLIEKTA